MGGSKPEKLALKLYDGMGSVAGNWFKAWRICLFGLDRTTYLWDERCSLPDIYAVGALLLSRETNKSLKKDIAADFC